MLNKCLKLTNKSGPILHGVEYVFLLLLLFFLDLINLVDTFGLERYLFKSDGIL